MEKKATDPGDTKKSSLYSVNSYYYYYYYKEKIWLFNASILSKISLLSSGFGNGGMAYRSVEGQVGEVPRFPQQVLPAIAARLSAGVCKVVECYAQDYCE